MHQILALYHAIPAATWAAIAAALGISGLMQKLKRWIESEKVIMTVLTAISALSGFVPYFLSSAALHPTVLGQYTAAMVGLTTLAYTFVIKPVAKWSAQNQLTKANATAAAAEAPPASVDAPKVFSV